MKLIVHIFGADATRDSDAVRDTRRDTAARDTAVRDTRRDTLKEQLIKISEIEGVVASKALLPIDPPLGRQAMDCAGVICLWCDPERLPEVLLPETLFPGMRSYVYGVEEHRRKVPDHDTPIGEPSPGFVWVTFMRRLESITHDEFASRWCDGHWPLVKKHHPAVWGYTQNVVTSSLTSDAPQWDAIGELHFKTPEDMRDRMYDSEEGKQIIWNDINRFLDTAAGDRFYAQEIIVSKQ